MEQRVNLFLSINIDSERFFSELQTLQDFAKVCDAKPCKITKRLKDRRSKALRFFYAQRTLGT